MGFLVLAASMMMLMQIAGALIVSERGRKKSSSSHCRKSKKTRKEQQSSSKDVSSAADLSSWASFRKLITCKYDVGKIEEPNSNNRRRGSSGYERVVYHASSLCSSSVVTGAAGGGDGDSEKNNGEKEGVRVKSKVAAAAAQRMGSSSGGGGGGYYGRRWSACSECRVMNTMLGPVPVSSVKVCPCCSQCFATAEALAQHHSSKHAVSELSENDSARNVVEIIFKTSWLKAHTEPQFSIQRILKIHNTDATLQRFEEYRDSIKTRAGRATATANSNASVRCSADGNELLRFHCASLECSLGAYANQSLCDSAGCRACAIIRHGFADLAADSTKVFPSANPNYELSGVCTSAGSGTAHDWMDHENNHRHGFQQQQSSSLSSKRRAMLVCRVVAGRVYRNNSNNNSNNSSPGFIDSACACAVESLDSFATVWSRRGIRPSVGDEIMLCNPRAVLPCFVVIYHTLAAAPADDLQIVPV